MFNPRPTRDVIILLGSLATIAAVTGLLRMIPDVSPTTVALALLLVVLGTATIGAPAGRARRVGRGDAHAELLLPAAGRHLHDRRSAELDRACSPS